MNRFDTEESTDNVVMSSASVKKNAYDGYGAYRKRYERNTMPDSRILVFLTGFCAGMVFFYMLRGKDAGVFGWADQEHLARLRDFEVYQSGLFEYVSGLRIKQLFFCIICSLSTISGALAYAIMGWYGFEAGLIVFSLVYQYGIKGILLTFSMFLPHGIFYMIVFLAIFSRAWGRSAGSCHNGATENVRHKKMERMKRIVLVLGLFLIGMLCEIYINPELIKKVALFF